MVYRQTVTQLSIESFGTALSTPLSADNEWVQLADQMPWQKLTWIIHLGIGDMKSHLAGLKATFGSLRILTERRSW